MPDLTIMQQCASLAHQAFAVRGSTGRVYTVTFETSEQTGPTATCTCAAFKYSNGKACKHIRAAQPRHCTWHQMDGKAIQEDGVCPVCGGPTQYVRVAV
jgi:hypothetical protein